MLIQGFRIMKNDKFFKKANSYDKLDRRVLLARAAASKIKEQITLNKDMHLIDFGSGTGLLLEQFANDVKKITAIDISPSMNAVLKSKNLPCELDILEIDITKTEPEIKADGIISSMTTHHIKDIQKLFKTFYKMLKPNGFLAIADLDKEDGSFHETDTGVEHFGFEREEFVKLAQNAGFKNCKIQDLYTIKKPYGKYDVFLLSAVR